MAFQPIPEATERLVTVVIDAAFTVHKTLGPGLLESIYEACLCHELAKRKIPYQRQVCLPIKYDGLMLDTGLRLDLLVADAVIIELKAVEQLHSLYEAQLLTYFKLSDKRLGLLINFNVELFKHGIKRVVL